MKPHFIGLGAQRSGTSWIYACIYEHPQLHMPIKEINFFGRQWRYDKGFDWYEDHFKDCPTNKLPGEFSTTYLDSEEAPRRIHEYHPDVKLVVSLRNPVERAMSNYRNDIMGGVVSADTPFEQALEKHPEYVTQGMYHEQLQRYLEWFPREQLLVLIYDDALTGPGQFIRQLLDFLGVDSQFHPSMLGQKVNVGRTPKSVALDLAMDSWSGALRRRGLHRLVWLVKKTGMATFVRGINARSQGPSDASAAQRAQLRELFAPDIRALESLLQRDLNMWLQDLPASGGLEHPSEPPSPDRQG